MEVNKPESAAPLGRDGKRKLLHQEPPLDHDDGAQADDAHGKDNWAGDDGFQMDGVLGDTITPEVQSLLSKLAGQIEPLRQDLDRARARERELRNQIERHPYLPVLNRDGLEHELSRVVGHLQGLGSAAFICISIMSAERLRREQGRRIYEMAMVHACESLRQVIGHDDIAGCLGGHDLGVLVLAPGDDPVKQLGDDLRQMLTSRPFEGPDGGLILEIQVGGIMLRSGQTFVTALDGADKDMLNR